MSIFQLHSEPLVPFQPELSRRSIESIGEGEKYSSLNTNTVTGPGSQQPSWEHLATADHGSAKDTKIESSYLNEIPLQMSPKGMWGPENMKIKIKRKM